MDVPALGPMTIIASLICVHNTRSTYATRGQSILMSPLSQCHDVYACINALLQFSEAYSSVTRGIRVPPPYILTSGQQTVGLYKYSRTGSKL
jgi:hypothetical protein